MNKCECYTYFGKYFRDCFVRLKSPLVNKVLIVAVILLTNTTTMKSSDKRIAGPHDKLQSTNEHIKTDLPLSEKDEVKQAEEKMRRRTKKLL